MPPAHAAGAASVVTQLRAFLKEPEGNRSQFGAGRASFEGGHHVLRFAQGKFAPGLAHDLPTHEREELRTAAVAFIREVCFREGASHYQMLCLSADAKREAVKESYHLLMALIHPDRAEVAREAWPADWAQRANRAYAVLADEGARAAYDKALNVFATPSPRPRRAPRVRGRTRRTPGVTVRVARAMLALGAVVATLVLLDAWVSGFSGDPVAFHRAASGRDIGANAERPRFLGANVSPARDTAHEAESFAQASRATLLAPLWRDPIAVPEVESKPERRASGTRLPAPMAVAEAESATREGPVVDAAPAPATRLAQAPPAEPAAREARPSSAEIEIVVARLIGYYEAGETDKLIALLDPREAGNVQAQRMRQAYGDFFRATRERRLHVKQLDWQNAPASAHAQGQATLQAEYVDASASLERDIDVEMEIVLRDGQARIARLTLFPNVPQP